MLTENGPALTYIKKTNRGETLESIYKEAAISVLKLAHDVGVELKKSLHLSWQTKKKQADWIHGFLSLTKTETTSLARAMSFSKSNVHIFLNNSSDFDEPKKKRSSYVTTLTWLAFLMTNLTKKNFPIRAY